MDKSIHFIFSFLFLISSSIISKGQILTEGFEGSFPPIGWTQEFVTNNNSWTAITGNTNGSITTAHNGILNASIVNFSTSPDITKLVSPSMNLSSVSSAQLEFWYSQEEWGPDQDELRVYYKTSFSGPWVLLATYTANVTAWTQELIALPALSSDYYIAFEGTAKYGRGVTIDDVLVATCFPPSNLTAATPTSTSANVGWTDNSGAINWEVEGGLAGFTQGTGALVQTSSNPHTFTGLNANTNYSFYVRAICGVGDTSAWAGPFNFTTPCASLTAPWVENFDGGTGIPSCWNQGGANAENWRFGTNAGHLGNAGNTGGSTSNSGSRFAWVDDSSPSNTATTLISPLIDVSALTTPALSFYTISDNEGHSNVNFSVDVFDGAVWNTGFYTSNDNTFNGEWEPVLMNLSSLTITGNIQLRFVVDEVVSGDYYDDRAIDDIRIAELPACPQPALISASSFTDTTAEISWMENGTATSWEVEYGPTGFTPGTGTTIMTNTNPVTITGLISMNSYDVCVRSVCGGSNSSWTCYSFDVPFIFSSSNLPIVVINTGGQTIVDDPRITATMGIIHNAPLRNNITDPFNNYNGQISIEFRGSSSQSFPKKAYGLETQDILGGNNNVSLVDMPVENDWILYAPYSDKSLMRNTLTYHFGNKLMDYAPRTKMCELVINGEYRGVYVLMEKIKQDQNRVDIADLTVNDIAGDSLSGGYILKVDKTTGGSSYDFMSNYLPPNAAGGQQIGYQIHYPKPDTILQVQVDYIHAYIDSFENALNAPNFADSTLGYPAFADGMSFIDFYIMNEITRNVDGYRISTYLYKDKMSNGGKLKMGPLWDFNIALGNANYCNGDLTTGWAKDFNVGCGNHGQLIPFWWDKLEQDPAYVNLRRCRWDNLRQDELHTDSIMAYIDNMALYLGESQQRNFVQWPILGNYIWPNNFIGNTYQEEVNYLKTWLADRLIWMDANMPGIGTNCGLLLDNSKIAAVPITTRIYPNPASDLIFIEGFEFNEVVIYNNLGQIIATKTTRGTTIYDVVEMDVSSLTSGVYLVELRGQQNRITKKVVIR